MCKSTVRFGSFELKRESWELGKTKNLQGVWGAAGEAEKGGCQSGTYPYTSNMQVPPPPPNV